MNPAIAMLRTIAHELAAQARSSFPKLKADETIGDEWLDAGIYYRKTSAGRLMCYDFRSRKVNLRKSQKGM